MSLRLIAIVAMTGASMGMGSAPDSRPPPVPSQAPSRAPQAEMQQLRAKIATASFRSCNYTNFECWTRSSYDSPGDLTTIGHNSPVGVPLHATGAVGIAPSEDHACASTTSGGANCWGFSSDGQLGAGRRNAHLTQEDLLTSVVGEIAAGAFHTCALITGGWVRCWGSNGLGQLGDGTFITRTTPVSVSGLASGVSSIATGGSHTCALTNEGGVKCWGYNASGQLGDGTMTIRNTPVSVSGLMTGVVSIAAGNGHSCALTAATGAKCWGLNDFGQVGDATTEDALTPKDVSGLMSGVAFISAGGHHTCALTSGGAAKCWGRNNQGQLGDGSTSDSLIPVDVSGLSSGVAAISAGNFHTCALTASGGVKCWGWNVYGQLGDETTDNNSTPVDVSGLTSGVIAISARGDHACALTTSGGLKCWGFNNRGQLGDGTTSNRNSPVDVSGLTSGVISFATGNSHVCALTLTDAKCWGWNVSGQLGDGTTIDRLTPVDVVSLAFEIYLPLITR